MCAAFRGRDRQRYDSLRYFQIEVLYIATNSLKLNKKTKPETRLGFYVLSGMPDYQLLPHQLVEPGRTVGSCDPEEVDTALQRCEFTTTSNLQ